jgi:NAD(P)-dependent dehydrogenase (short-subunit alcohol dehydrogenase family)
MAHALATNGASKIYLLGRRLSVLTTAASSHPTILIPIQCDVTSHGSLQSAVDRITAEEGYINLLIANSGIGGPHLSWDPSASLSEMRERIFSQANMDKTTQAMEVNVTGAYFTIIAFLELLDKGNQRAIDTEIKEKLGAGEVLFGAPIEGGGNPDVPSIQSQVIVTSSIAAFSRAPQSSPGYAGSKAAILHLTKQVSSNLAKFGIRANALAPGCKLLLLSVELMADGECV